MTSTIENEPLVRIPESRVAAGRVARALRLFACVLALSIVFPSAGAPASREGTDLSVAWIERRPKIPYVWGSDDPATEGWPRAGRRVRWIAHVRNLGDRTLRRVGFRWLLDGQVVASGEATLGAGRQRKFRLPWRWEKARHEIVFEIDPDERIAEQEERNNRLLVHTDALAIGFWVERSFWDGIREIVTRAGIGATTFDDWMQKKVRQFNEMAVLARYPGAPEGVLDRWRVDAIHVVPDGALPVSPLGDEVPDWGAGPDSYPTLYPDTEDRTVDMEWGFPASTISWYADWDAWPLLYSSLNHEIGHARYLVDVYAWDVDDTYDVVDIEPGPPRTGPGILFRTPENGLMNTSWGYLDRYSVLALNRIAGQRATRGHYNEPANLGEFLNDLPQVNRVRIVDPEGRPFQKRPVRLYQAASRRDHDWMDHPYRLDIDGKADLELRTDADGVIELGRNPFADRPLEIAVDRNNTLAIVEVLDRSGGSHWGYLEARRWNLAYWNGDVQVAEHELVMDAPVCFGPGLGPTDVKPYHEALVEGPTVTFEWPTGQARAGYELWTAVDGHPPARVHVTPRLGARTASATLRLRGERVAWWLEYSNPHSPPSCPAVRSSTYFFDLRRPQ